MKTYASLQNLTRGVAARAVARSNSLSILIYHRVHARKDDMRNGDPDAECFDWHMQLAKKYFNVLPLAEANRLRCIGQLPARAMSITFDDGYADNAEVALPILQKHGLPATFFVASNYINGGTMWNDIIIETLRRMPPESGAELRDLLPEVNSQVFEPLDSLSKRRELMPHVIQAIKYRDPKERHQLASELASRTKTLLPDSPMMTIEQVQQLHEAGMEIGGHTRSHPILATLDAKDARKEIEGNKRQLEDWLNAPVTSFAYPNGQPSRDYSKQTRSIVAEAGYQVAVSTAYGASTKSDDSLQLPRFTPWDKQEDKFLLRLLLNTWKHNAERAMS